MTNDSKLFRTREQLESDGWILHGNVFECGPKQMLPLYEAKMIHHYDHRWATYNGLSIRDSTLTEKQNPGFFALPRYWVPKQEVNARLGDRWDKQWFLVCRDICRSTDERTVITSSVPVTAVGNNLPIVLSQEDAACIACLQANLSSFILDYVARQKIGGTHLNLFIFEQIPVLAPTTYIASTPWQDNIELRDWLADRVLELSYIAWNMATFADDLGYEWEPFQWSPSIDRRALLRAELDAAFFHLYSVSREDADYILDKFPIVRRKDENQYEEYRTKRLILEIFDSMQKAIDTGMPYQTVLDPPPGQVPRHLERSRKAQ
jgi:hypothetical protein